MGKLRLATMVASASVGVLAFTPATAARGADWHVYHLPAQPLADALRSIAVISGRAIIAPAALVEGKTAAPLDGDFATRAAVTALLATSGLHARPVANGFVIESDGQSAADGSASDDIVVTGSRIRGAKIASPVITVTRDDARNAGQTSLGEIARSLPQSFGGGQNPGIGFNVPSINGVDLGGASSINLRGLGSDATLTLLNGHRLAYSSSRQSVDVSTIPLGMLDRIEIVADGASALYGSDAVGGVANIILRRDMDGVETRARLGAATEGGDVEQQYGITGGSRWSSGGFIAAYEVNRSSAVDSSQRAYAARRSTGLRLLPSSRSNNVVVSAHQKLGEGFDFTVDGLFNQRKTLFIYPQNAAGDLALSRSQQPTNEKAFAIAPTLSKTLGDTGHIELSGSYAKDRVDYRNVLITPDAVTPLTAGCYCNRTLSLELSGDERLFHLPGGWARLALGAGHRSTSLRSDRGAGNYQNFDQSLTSSYGFAELSLPVLSPGSAIGSVDLDGAVRNEHYRSIGSVATPKFGLIWSPGEAIDFKASWGRSFRAPTLLQRYQPNLVTLYPVSSLGGTGYPAGSSALYVTGGSAALKPERASSWSVTADLHPKSLPRFDVELSYFSTNYVDRIVAPISFTTQSLSNPLYAAQITRSPTLAVIESTVANAALFQKTGGAVYDPAQVVALVNNSNVNAGRQPLHGLDGFLSYRVDLGPSDKLTASGSASYLVSSRQISAYQPITQLAGVLFNPPHWRARGSLGWQRGGLGITTTLSYIGDLRDTRSTPALRIPGQATVDLALRYRTSERVPAALRGLDLTLSVQDLFDATPPPIVTSLVTDTPYDSTNYSPIGRFVSLSIAKKW